MTLCVACLTALELTPVQLVDAAAAAGLDGVTLRMFPPRSGEPLMPVAGDAALLRETRARLDHHGLNVLDVEALMLGPGADLDAAMPGLEAAAGLGAEHVLVIGGHADPGAMAAALHELCERCEALGIRPALEFMVFSAVRTVQAAVDVVVAADHPAAAVLVDPLHLSRSGGTPEQVADAVREQPQLFPYAQLCDAPATPPAGGTRELYREAVTRRLAPGDGGLPLRELLAALPEGVPLCVEAPVVALAALPGAEQVARVGAAARAWLAAG
jgi:sugar phosphate isomerase/epimerase